MESSIQYRMLANREVTEPPSCLTYYYVVSSDTVSLAFFLAALNYIDIMECDVGNEYFNALCRGNILFAADPEHRTEKNIR